MSTQETAVQRDGEEERWEQLRERVLEREGYECRFCGMSDEEHTEENSAGLDVHHILPRKDGGEDSMGNLVALCRSCHRTMETLHGQAMAELDSDSELADSVAGVLESMSLDASEAWAELFGGPFVPEFFRDDNGRGVLLAGRESMTAREKACLNAGRVEAMWYAGEQLRTVLEKSDVDVDLDRHSFQRRDWSDHIARCGCGKKVDTVAHSECPHCGAEVR